MKKLTLFLVAITMSLFSFAAQPKRIYAYDLSSALVDKVYTFSFTANETPTSGKIIFYDATSSDFVGEIALNNPVLGKNEVEIAEYNLPGNDGQQLNWSVELSAAAVTAIDALNDPSLSQFKFYLPQDVAVDNSPESDFFGRVYVANPGTGSGYVAAGISVYDQELNKLGDGYKATGHTISSRTDIHRLAVQPQTGKIYYAKTGSSTAIYELIPNQNGSLSDGGSSVNVISGVSEIKNANSLCFDENGLLWILNYANYVDAKTTGVIYSVDNKVATLFTKNDPNVYQWVSNDNAIAPDGLGGFWVAQYRSNFDGFYVLSHVNKEGVLDFYINNKTNNTLIPTSGTGSSINASYRGHLAYYSKENILAFGGADRVTLFTIEYDNEGKPALTKLGETPSIRHTDSHKNIDGIAFDYAGNLYMASATREKLFVYTIPTTNNTCEVPAKKADVVTKVEAAVALYTVTTNVNDPAMGSVSGNLGTYEDGASAELTAVANEHYEFVNWTGDVESTDNPLTVAVNSDMTITANFEKQKHILTVFVNDENKGTIDVATGSYEYGTEVTLTATPKLGYKLLAWSNKATTPSITLTMDNNKAVSAYFVKEYATDPTFTIEKVWENTNVPAATANGFQGVGWDGKIYVKDRYNAAINVYTETGSELYAQLGATVTGLAGDQPIAVDDAGNLVVRSGSTNFYDSPTQVSIFRKNENTPEVIDFTLPATDRCDFISASGDIFGEKGGYVYFFCMNQTTVSRLHIKNGEYEGVDTIAIVAEEGKAASQSHVVVDIYGNIHTSSKGKNAYEYNITTLTTTADSYLGAATKKTPKSTIGGCTFELGGKELWAYVAGITNYSSEWELKNVTDGVLVSNEVLYATDDKTTVNSNTAANWLNVQVVDEKTAYIYQFCPTVAAAVWKVSLKENYIVSASATNGTVKGAGTYQEGATATLTATPNTGYKFVNWTKGGETITDNPYTFTVSDNVALVANFEAITSKDPRAWAYDMKLGEDGDNYTFTFKATAAGQATISFKDKDGDALAQPASQKIAAVVGENKFTIAKSAFAAGVDAFWSITMDGAPIEGVVEVTDQSRGIYDFYNMMGVVVDNNTDSKDFGKIYVQMSLAGTTQGKAQTPGLFLFDQKLDGLNSNPNVGIQPSLPAEYTIGGDRNKFHRLNINPNTGDLVYSYNIASSPAVFAINREDMTTTNLLTGVVGFTRTAAHCFDAEGTLYVIDIANNQGRIYRVKDGVATPMTEATGKLVNASIAMESDGNGGLWVSHNRGQMDAYYQLAHIASNGAIDWYIDSSNPQGFEGSSARGALAYDVERQILAQGRNGKVELYTVSYEPTITLTPLHTIASNDLGNNIDGLAFDYAGDLYVVNSSKEKFQKFTLPTADNICTVAAPALEAVRFTPVYTVNVESNNNEWGIANGGGTFEEGQNATITAVAATNYEFVNWTKEGAEVSIENPYTFAVTESATYVANFVEITKYTIDVTYDNIMGTVEGAGTYYEGTEVTLTATAKGGYVFVNWSDGNTDETRTFTAGVDMPETLTANFKVAVPRAWAYDLRLDADTDPANYTFTFKTTSAGTATLIFKDEDGNIQNFGTHTATANAAEEKTITIAKTVFAAATKDIYWEVELAGDAIAKMAEITDPTRNIYDFYNMMGVVVDNDPNSEMFGKIYIQQSYNGAADGIADRSDTQTAGIFIYDQGLNELNNPANVGIKPQLPYTIGANRQVFKRITINPSNGDIAFCNNTTTNGGAYAVSRENLAGEAINLTKHISDIQKVNALCFDDEGNLYVAANVSTSGAPNGNIYQIKTDGTYTELTSGSLFYDQEIAMASDGRGGLWIAQNRWGTAVAPLFHVNVAENKIDFKVEADKDYSDWFAGANYRGAIAYDKQRDILAVHSQACASVFQVTYAAGVPSISKICQTPNLGKNELDGLAFDYAGDLYVVHSGTERFYKYVLPTNTNTCTVPAPESQIIMKEARYTVTVVADPVEMGTVTEGGEYKAGEKVTLTATANDGYRFVNWTIGSDVISTDASFEYTVPAENVTITAHFELKPLAMVGVVKRAVQIGESTVVLTHEANGTPHLYKVVDGELEAEISQVGVIARDPDNAGDYLSISDIAVTEDGKLVAINKIECQSDENQVVSGYKRGELRAYIWNDLAGAPALWFTSKMSSNWYRSVQGHTMAVKGTSQNAEIFTTGTHGTNGRTRFSWYHIIDGVFEEPAVNTNDYYHFHNGPDNIYATGNSLEKLVGTQYELNASPLEADRWIMDGNLVEPYEYVLPATNNVALTEGTALATDLGKKFNGATYLTVLGKHLMVAPYADSENVAGVTVLDITNGLDQAEEMDYAELTSPVLATAAATAVKVNGDDLTITLVVDNKVYIFSIDLNLQYTRTVTNGNFGTICLPYGSNNYSGAEFYEIAYLQLKDDGVTPMGIWLDEVIELEAGKPYIFKATSNLLTVNYKGEEALSPVDGKAGLTGTFDNITDETVLQGNYMIAENKFWLCGTGCWLNANRAYIEHDALHATTTPVSPIPGRRRVMMGAAGENTTTGVDNLTEDGVVSTNQATKMVVNGQLIIIRDGVKYNAQGVRL